jgi:hypothetical protein
LLLGASASRAIAHQDQRLASRRRFLTVSIDTSHRQDRTLSNAQFLRVIGQDLDALGADFFELAKWSDDYIVWLEHSEFAIKLSSEKGFLSKITQRILGQDDSDTEIPNRINFTPSDIIWADTQRQLKRKKSGSPSDLRDLSFVLRVLGDYLDRQKASQFTISYWPKHSIMISYDQKQERFTSENLYDFGIHMYLRRSTRDSAT